MIDIRYAKNRGWYPLIVFSLLAPILAICAVYALLSPDEMIQVGNPFADQLIEILFVTALVAWSFHTLYRAIKSFVFRRKGKSLLELSDNGAGVLRWPRGQLFFQVPPDTHLEYGNGWIRFPEDVRPTEVTGWVGPYQKTFQKVWAPAKYMQGGEQEIFRQINLHNQRAL